MGQCTRLVDGTPQPIFLDSYGRRTVTVTPWPALYQHGGGPPTATWHHLQPLLADNLRARARPSLGGDNMQQSGNRLQQRIRIFLPTPKGAAPANSAEAELLRGQAEDKYKDLMTNLGRDCKNLVLEVLHAQSNPWTTPDFTYPMGVVRIEGTLTVPANSPEADNWRRALGEGALAQSYNWPVNVEGHLGYDKTSRVQASLERIWAVSAKELSTFYIGESTSWAIGRLAQRALHNSRIPIGLLRLFTAALYGPLVEGLGMTLLDVVDDINTRQFLDSGQVTVSPGSSPPDTNRCFAVRRTALYPNGLNFRLICKGQVENARSIVFQGVTAFATPTDGNDQLPTIDLPLQEGASSSWSAPPRRLDNDNEVHYFVLTDECDVDTHGDHIPSLLLSSSTDESSVSLTTKRVAHLLPDRLQHHELWNDWSAVWAGATTSTPGSRLDLVVGSATWRTVYEHFNTGRAVAAVTTSEAGDGTLGAGETPSRGRRAAPGVDPSRTRSGTGSKNTSRPGGTASSGGPSRRGGQGASDAPDATVTAMAVSKALHHSAVAGILAAMDDAILPDLPEGTTYTLVLVPAECRATVEARYTYLRDSSRPRTTRGRQQGRGGPSTRPQGPPPPPPGSAAATTRGGASLRGTFRGRVGRADGASGDDSRAQDRSEGEGNGHKKPKLADRQEAAEHTTLLLAELREMRAAQMALQAEFREAKTAMRSEPNAALGAGGPGGAAAQALVPTTQATEIAELRGMVCQLAGTVERVLCTVSSVELRGTAPQSGLTPGINRLGWGFDPDPSYLPPRTLTYGGPSNWHPSRPAEVQPLDPIECSLLRDAQSKELVWVCPIANPGFPRHDLDNRTTETIRRSQRSPKAYSLPTATVHGAMVDASLQRMVHEGWLQLGRRIDLPSAVLLTSSSPSASGAQACAPLLPTSITEWLSANANLVLQAYHPGRPPSEERLLRW